MTNLFLVRMGLETFWYRLNIVCIRHRVFFRSVRQSVALDAFAHDDSRFLLRHFSTILCKAPITLANDEIVTSKTELWVVYGEDCKIPSPVALVG